MYKQYRTDLSPTAGDRPRLEVFWSEHWGGLDIESLCRGLERTELWPIFERSIPPGSRILEAGCGPGHWVRFLNERGFAAFGVDLAETALARSRLSVDSLPVSCADLRALPFPDESFDAYISLGVIEHFEKGPEEILAEARRIVRPGGALLVSVPYLSWAKRAAIWRRGRREGDGSDGDAIFYQYVMTARELAAILTRAGLDVVRLSRYGVEGGLQNRLPAIGSVKERIRRGPSSLVRRALPAMHVTWDLFVKLLPPAVLAHMIMAVCRRPESPAELT